MRLLKNLSYLAVLFVTLTTGLVAVAGFRFVQSSATSASVTENRAIESEVFETQNALIEPAAVELTENDETAHVSYEEPSYRTGYYSLELESASAPFKDIDYFELFTEDYREVNGEYKDVLVPPQGSIEAQKTFKFTKIAVGINTIAFQTATVGGISYKFSGEFQDAGEPVDSRLGGKRHPDLKGRLIKIKDGKWAAETDAEFFYFEGC